MDIKQLFGGLAIAGSLGMATLGAGVGVANAAPGPQPGPPGANGAPANGAPPAANHGEYGNSHPMGERSGSAAQGGPGQWHGDDQRGYGQRGGDQRGYERGYDQRGGDQRGYSDHAPWGDGMAPWGRGEPPRPRWDRPLPPDGGQWNDGPINYYGFQRTPEWDPGFHQWGIRLFGMWIPL